MLRQGDFKLPLSLNLDPGCFGVLVEGTLEFIFLVPNPTHDQGDRSPFHLNLSRFKQIDKKFNFPPAFTSFRSR
jgi:hypothetical protein